jgi:Cdc6-like AAA superfamily ATPase
MPLEDNQQIARAFVQLTKRAETADPATLVQTFVDIGTLLPSISTRDNQVVFGRRGTGKTHALVYALETAKSTGALTVYVDLRAAGSSSSIYSNVKTPIAEKATILPVSVAFSGVRKYRLSTLPSAPKNAAFSRKGLKYLLLQTVGISKYKQFSCVFWV